MCVCVLKNHNQFIIQQKIFIVFDYKIDTLQFGLELIP